MTNSLKEPSVVSNQVLFRKFDLFPVPDDQSGTTTRLRHGQQQQFEQPDWEGTYPQAGYTPYEMGHQTFADPPLAFNERPWATPTDLQYTLPPSMLATVNGAAGVWGAHTLFSPGIELFADPTADHFSGHPEHGQDPSFSSYSENHNMNDEGAA
ncbi:hypothetical protein IFR04_006861 [Cadophora malorum]|uniref:Uncharacterized protein n=1 Tax=Cadophora malorum TaxID=108018 RepID=A0A8H7W7H6_9HELO|nr:hypothetical protein IFR04_006861 [Cadophora malorum]